MAGAVQMDTALLFLLEEKGVVPALQDKLAEAGVSTLAEFANIDDSKADVRKLVRDEWSYDTTAHPHARAHIGCFLDAWEGAKSRMAREHEESSQARTANTPATLPSNDHLFLKHAFEVKFLPKDAKGVQKKMPRDEIPSDTLVELRLNYFAEGEQKAELFTKVTAKTAEQGGSSDIGADIVGNALRVTKVARDGKMPRGSEELRAKIKLWGNSWIFASLRHVSRPQLFDLNPSFFSTYAEFLCGKEVLGMESKDEFGVVVSRPSLLLVLEYDFRIREEAADLMNSGMSFVHALTQAQLDTTLRTNCFITPMMASSVSQALASAGSGRGRARSRSPKGQRKEWVLPPPPKWNAWTAKGKGKGKEGKCKKGKGKGKDGKGKAAASAFKNGSTPDGRQICFKFNNQGERCKGSCGRIHCCTSCYRPTPEHACSHTDSSGLVGQFA
jgi:hypothetical protein